MQNLAVARKYANALFDAAKKAGTLDRIGQDMESLAKLKTDDPAFLQFLLSPEAMAHQKHAFIQAVFENRVDPSVVGLLRLLVDKGRIQELPEVCSGFQELWEEHKGVVRVQVETPMPLPQDQEDRLKDELQKLSGLDVILEKRTNKAMIGGIIVFYRDKIIDKSIRRGLRQLNETLMSDAN